MIFLSVQPNTPYFIWQLRVQMNNFQRMGVDMSKVYVCFGYNDVYKECNDFIEEYRDKINIFSTRDGRADRSYIPSIRPFVLKKFFKLNKQLEQEVIFYHDCDILFTSLPDFDSLIEDKNVYVSDTRSYLNHTYISSKGQQLFKDMCNIVGISPYKVILNNGNAGGAQYLFKGITSEFWEKVEKDCTNLYNHMISSQETYAKIWAEQSGNDMHMYHPIQAWCADMWAVLWNLLKDDQEVEISSELDFTWATSKFSELLKSKIYHNAGATKNTESLFQKSQYTKKNPFYENFDNFKFGELCSSFYVEEILLTKQNL